MLYQDTVNDTPTRPGARRCRTARIAARRHRESDSLGRETTGAAVPQSLVKPSTGREMARMMLRLRVILACSVAIGLAAVAVTTATAGQPVGGPYAPKISGGTVTGWVNMDGTCAGAYCDTYMKIERSSWSGWRYVSGGWISRRSGWISMSGAKLSGTYDYRTVVEDYVTVINTSSLCIGAYGVQYCRQNPGYVRLPVRRWVSGSTRG
jgi:hypothetical protein